VTFGDRERGLPMVTQARQLAEDSADPESIAHTTFIFALAMAVHGEGGLATRIAEKGLELELALPQPNPYVSLARHTLGVAFEYAGQPERAIAVLEANHADLAAAGELLMQALVLTRLAVNEMLRGQIAKAAAWAREILEIRRDFHGSREFKRGVEILAWAAAEDHDYVRAARLFGIGEQLWQPLGQDRTSLFYVEQRERYQQRARQVLGERTFQAEVRRGARLSLDQVIAYALSPAPAPAGEAGRKVVALAELTRRERQVANLVAEGLSNRQIADELVISPRTAENHVEHVLAKLGFTSRVQITSWIAEHRP
jgi:non-specific serine/threonine protein kinase